MSSAASGLSDSVSASVLNQDDPETAKAALPTFMVLMDGFITDNPDDPDILSSGAMLYASYGAIFADDEARASRLTTRARGYALRERCANRIHRLAAGPTRTMMSLSRRLMASVPSKASTSIRMASHRSSSCNAHSSDMEFAGRTCLKSRRCSIAIWT